MQVQKHSPHLRSCLDDISEGHTSWGEWTGKHKLSDFVLQVRVLTLGIEEEELICVYRNIGRRKDSVGSESEDGGGGQHHIWSYITAVSFYLRLLVWLDDQRYKEVQNGIDEKYQKNGDEELAEYENAHAIILTHPSVAVPQVITIEHGEESVKWLIIIFKLQSCAQEKKYDA